MNKRERIHQAQTEYDTLLSARSIINVSIEYAGNRLAEELRKFPNKAKVTLKSMYRSVHPRDFGKTMIIESAFIGENGSVCYRLSHKSGEINQYEEKLKLVR